MENKLDLARLKALALAATPFSLKLPVISNNDDYLAFIAACSPDVVVKLVEALEEARVGMQKYIHVKSSCNHDDGSWCDDSCMDYGRLARKWLEKWGAK